MAKRPLIARSLFSAVTALSARQHSHSCATSPLIRASLVTTEVCALALAYAASMLLLKTRTSWLEPPARHIFLKFTSCSRVESRSRSSTADAKLVSRTRREYSFVTCMRLGSGVGRWCVDETKHTCEDRREFARTLSSKKKSACDGGALVD